MSHFMVRALPCQLCTHSCTMDQTSSHTSLRHFTITFYRLSTRAMKTKRISHHSPPCTPWDQVKARPNHRVVKIPYPGLHQPWSNIWVPHSMSCVGPMSDNVRQGVRQCPTRCPTMSDNNSWCVHIHAVNRSTTGHPSSHTRLHPFTMACSQLSTQTMNTNHISHIGPPERPKQFKCRATQTNTLTHITMYNFQYMCVCMAVRTESAMIVPGNSWSERCRASR